MDWFNALGNMARFFPDAPALAFDFALNGADPDLAGYGMAYGLQASPIPIEVYPSEGMGLPGLGA